jgi:hypothetical protein
VADPERYLLSLVLRSPYVASSLLDDISLDDVLDARHRELLMAVAACEGDAEALRAGLDPELAEYADELLAVAPGPTSSPGVTSRDMRQAARRLAHTRYQFRLREVQSEIAAARRSGDEAEVAEQLRRMTLLAQRKPSFDPDASPYFRDTRSATA